MFRKSEIKYIRHNKFAFCILLEFAVLSVLCPLILTPRSKIRYIDGQRVAGPPICVAPNFQKLDLILNSRKSISRL